MESHNLGEVLFAPVDVYLDEKNVYQPDLIFISKDQLNILQNTIKGVPDLVIEILSKGSEKLDKIEKKEVYERTGVKEYWIVEPETKKVWGYRLEDKLFKEILSQDGIFNQVY